MTRKRPPLTRPLPLWVRNPFAYWLLLALLALLAGFALHVWRTAQPGFQVHAAPASVSQNEDDWWEELPERERYPHPLNVMPGRSYRALRLNRTALLEVLRKAPLEDSVPLHESQSVLSLPLPDGSLRRFRVEESPTMEPALAARYPAIKSYRGQAVEEPAMRVRFDWSLRGLHALILTNEETISIEPLRLNDLTNYVSYYSQDAVSPPAYECLTQQLPEAQESTAPVSKPRAFSFGAQRRNFRIAIATTVEYTNTSNLGGGSVASALASVNSWLNAVNAIYERDLAMHFNLVANNDQIIYTSSDSFTNGNASAMLDEVRSVLGQTIGTANYDVGHVLGTGGSGVAYLGVACYGSGTPGPYKGGGVSLIASSASLGNTFYVTRIAHELGHQFGATHSFNDSDANYACASNRTASSAWESGSGLTVMSYAGSCNPITVMRASHFHGGSINQIASYVENNGTCHSSASLSNNPPTVSGGSDYRIPRNTPFALTASASDPDSADLSYSWEQVDAGSNSYGNPPFTDAADAAGTARPIFRPFAPVSSPTRYFPSLTYILNNANVPPATRVESGYTVNTAESLPNVTRALNFKVTVRDQRGGVSDDDVLIEVDGGSGPFAVTAPNTNVSWTGGTQQTVTWNVNKTNAAPVNCTQVRLLLSTDGGNTFPITLLAATANDGSETLIVPSGFNSTTARIKVEAVNNVFFDISDVNFTLAAGSAACPTVSSLNPMSGPVGTMVMLTGANFTSLSSVKFTNNVSATFTVVSNTQVTVTVPNGATTGPLTLSRAGCADVRSSSFTVASCSYTLSPTTISAAADPRSYSVNVTAAAGCVWSAASNASWLRLSSGQSGNGSGVVNFIVDANSGPARSSTLTIAGQTITVNQASGCRFIFSPSSVTVPAAGASLTVNVTGAACPWTAVSSVPWISFPAGASGTGAGTLRYTVASNTSNQERLGQVVVGEQVLLVQQAGVKLFITSLSPAYVLAGGGQFTLTVTGQDFVNGATVRWNGSNRTTVFVSSTQLQAVISAADVTTAGKVNVTVFVPASNLTSPANVFMIAGAAANLSAASYLNASFAPEQIVAVFGQKLALATATATTLPLPLTLGGTRVLVKDSAGVERPAPLFFVWSAQINYQIPPGTAAGAATVTIQTDDGNMSVGTVQINSVAPGLFSANSNGTGWATGLVLRVLAGNQQRYETIAKYDPVTKKFIAVPIDLGGATDQVYLVLYGTGLRQRSSLSTVSCKLSGVTTTVVYAGKQGGLVGVDQLNLLLPRTLVGRGEVEVVVTVDGRQANPLKVQIK
jgi:uncharacterized protein (TIGR03437 family)